VLENVVFIKFACYRLLDLLPMEEIEFICVGLIRNWYEV
jgi:hypothetical protein